MQSSTNTGYLHHLSIFFMFLMLVSTAQALGPLDDEPEAGTTGASASFFVPPEQEQEIQSLTDFVEAGSGRTLEGFTTAATDLKAMLGSGRPTLSAQTRTLLHLGFSFIREHSDDNAFVSLLDIASLTRGTEGPEAYRHLLLNQEIPNTDKIMEEIRKVFYTARGRDRKKLKATGVDWVLALGKRRDIKADGFSDYIWRAQNWKYPPQRVVLPVVAEDVTHPKRRWGSRYYHNNPGRRLHNGRGSSSYSKSNSRSYSRSRSNSR